MWVFCQVVDGDIVSLACEVEEARLRLQHRWDEVSTRLQMERDVFSAQVSHGRALHGGDWWPGHTIVGARPLWWDCQLFGSHVPCDIDGR